MQTLQPGKYTFKSPITYEADPQISSDFNFRTSDGRVWNGMAYLCKIVNEQIDSKVLAYKQENSDPVVTLTKLGWEDVVYETFFIDTPQEVTDDFYPFINQFTTREDFTYTVLNVGEYRFKQSFSVESIAFTEVLNFIDGDGEEWNKMSFHNSADNTMLVYFKNNEEFAVAYAQEWLSQDYTKISIREPQTVTETFYNWFIKNTEIYIPVTYVDLPQGVYTFNDTIPIPSTVNGKFPLVFTDTLGVEWGAISLLSSTDNRAISYSDNYNETSAIVYAYGFRNYADGWQNDSFKTITINTTQSVDEKFYNWFIANTTESPVIPDPPSKYVIKAGTYIFDDILTITDNISQTILFKTNVLIDDIFTEVLCSEMVVSLSEKSLYYFYDGRDNVVYVENSGYWQEVLGISVKIITLDSDVEVSEEFYNWFTINTSVYYPNNVIRLYKNYCEDNVVQKQTLLQSVGVISGVFRDDFSVISPSVIIEYDQFPNFNYVYVEAFNRYYFVRDITSIRKNLWEIDLSIDVLMTYKRAIYDSYAFVDRNELEFDPFIEDDLQVIQEGYNVEDIDIWNGVFANYQDDDGSGYTDPAPTIVINLNNAHRREKP